MKKVVYVLVYIINHDLTQLVGLIKKKGPKILINKITVPGGKVEYHESIIDAASREAAEECGLEINPRDWTLFETIEGEDYSLNKLYAKSAKVAQAFQVEDEPVFVLDIEEHLESAKTNPEQYSPDFINNINKMLKHIKK